MLIRVTEDDFVAAFTECGRAEQFSREGLRELFKQLEDKEWELGEPILDVVELCCTWQELDVLELADQWPEAAGVCQGDKNLWLEWLNERGEAFLVPGRDTVMVADGI